MCSLDFREIACNKCPVLLLLLLLKSNILLIVLTVPAFIFAMTYIAENPRSQSPVDTGRVNVDDRF